VDNEERQPGFTDAPVEEESRRLAELGRELYAVDGDIAEIERKLELLTQRRTELTMKELPDYMRKISQDKIGLAEFGVDLVLENYYHANIRADWPEEKRQEAFAYLESINAGDMIKTQVVFMFGRKDIKKVRWLQAFIKTVQHYLGEVGGEVQDIPDPTISMAVPWNTLTAFVRGQVESGEVLDLEKIGAVVGSVVKIKQRKA
jgi:hypothetical protein